MKLSGLFTNEQHINQTNNRTQVQSAQNPDIARQIRDLVPGQTIRGEIVSRNGESVQIKIADDYVLNAKVDSGIHLEEGQNITFEVRNNGSTLALSPLQTNTAMDANVMKAIDMAGLPFNNTTVEMTEQLMKAGLPINRNTLQQVFREINSFPENPVSDVVNLHKLQMPVNETNMEQMAVYRNLNHQLLDGVKEILQELPEVVGELSKEGGSAEGLSFMKELVQLAVEADLSADTEGVEPQNGNTVAGATSENTNGIEGKADVAVIPDKNENHTSVIAQAEVVPGQSLAVEMAENANNVAILPETMNQEVMEGDLSVIITDSETGIVAEESLSGEILTDLGEIIQAMDLPEAQMSTLQQQMTLLTNSGSGSDTLKLVQNLIAQTEGSENKVAADALHKLFQGKDFQKLLTDRLKQQWTLKPEELSTPKKVEEFYRKMDRQLKQLAGALEDAGQSQSNLFKGVTEMNRNLDFMNQINQMYQYVQLPLRLQNSEAHGELYVYTNKRNLADKNGEISALLHLDMEHLGPLDVYVKLNEAKVSTNFYVADEEVLDFIEQHMDLLTDRLAKRGYNCTANVTARAIGEESQSGLKPLLGEQNTMISQYAFDVRT